MIKLYEECSVLPNPSFVLIYRNKQMFLFDHLSFPIITENEKKKIFWVKKVKNFGSHHSWGGESWASAALFNGICFSKSF